MMFLDKTIKLLHRDSSSTSGMFYLGFHATKKVKTTALKDMANNCQFSVVFFILREIFLTFKINISTIVLFFETIIYLLTLILPL